MTDPDEGIPYDEVSCCGVCARLFSEGEYNESHTMHEHHCTNWIRELFNSGMIARVDCYCNIHTHEQCCPICHGLLAKLPRIFREMNLTKDQILYLCRNISEQAFWAKEDALTDEQIKRQSHAALLFMGLGDAISMYLRWEKEQ